MKTTKNIRRAENSVYRSIIDIPTKNVLKLVGEETHKKFCRS